MSSNHPLLNENGQLFEQENITRISHFHNVFRGNHPQSRLSKSRKAALQFREDMLANDEQVVFFKTINLIRVPYPTRYGLLNASSRVSPFMHIMNRLYIVQFKTSTGVKTLLFSPSDIDGNRETPYFKAMNRNLGPFTQTIQNTLAPVYNRVEDVLQRLDIAPENIDYISYDHLHTQDLRKWLGSRDKPGLFPNARLLVMAKEWHSTQHLLPPQQQWYCPDGIDGIDENRIILLDSSVMLGKSVALIHTPGHTEGNHSLVVNTPDGLLVSSENGVSADSYSPVNSAIPGLSQYAKSTGMEVVLNGNTLEAGLDQYISMVMEKTIAGASPQNPDFCNVLPSSELTSYWAFPRLAPTFSAGEREYGKICRH